MDFKSNQSPSSSSSSSSLENVTPPNPKIKIPIIIPKKHKKKASRKIFKKTSHTLYRGAPRLPRPESSSSHQDIRKAALQAAKDFKPSSLTNLCENEGFACDYEKGRVLECEGSGFLGFMDEEAMFNMPGLLDSMAEGMLLTPLAMKKGFNWSEEVGDGEIELNLWGN